MDLIRRVTYPEHPGSWSTLASAQSIGNYTLEILEHMKNGQGHLWEGSGAGFQVWWLAGLVFRLCPSGRHIRTYSHTTLHQELVRGVASYPIHVPHGSATAQVNIMCIFNNTDCWRNLIFAPIQSLAKCFSSEIFSYTVNRTVKKSLTCINRHLYISKTPVTRIQAASCALVHLKI